MSLASLAAPPPGATHVIVDDLDEGLQAMRKADRPYEKAQVYYEGNIPEVFASPRLRAALWRSGVDFELNFAKTPVNAVVSRLKVNAVTSPDPAVQDWIPVCWKDNQLDIFESLSIERACEFGDAYLLVWPDETVPCGVRVYLNGPRVMRLLYDDENEIEKRFAIKKWAEGNRHRATLYYADRVEKYITKAGLSGNDRSDWVRYEDDGDGGWPVPNEYGEVPVYHLRTAFQYGVPVHKAAYGAQNLIHKLAMGHAGGIDYHTLPQRYAILKEGVSANDFSVGDEDETSFAIDSTGATASADDGKAQLRSEAGSIWMLDGVQALGEFMASDPQVFLAPMTFYVHAMAQITTTPAHYFDAIGQVPSGESLKVQEGPFVKKCEQLQLLFGSAWQDALAFAARVGMGLPQAPDVALHWAPCASVSSLDTWQTADIKLRLGVPARQLLIEAGYAEDEVDQWLDEGAQSLQQQIDTLNAIGVAAQGLAVAVQLGIIDEADIKTVLAEMLGFAPAVQAGADPRAVTDADPDDEPGALDADDDAYEGDGG